MKDARPRADHPIPVWPLQGSIIVCQRALNVLPFRGASTGTAALTARQRIPIAELTPEPPQTTGAAPTARFRSGADRFQTA